MKKVMPLGWDPNLPAVNYLGFSSIGIKYSDGTTVYKAMPDDGTKQDHEEHVLNLFLRVYANFKYGTEEKIEYTVIGNDGIDGQQHDYKVQVPAINEVLDIEITKLGEGSDTHLAHKLRQESFKLNDRFPGKYFVFLPANTNPKVLPQLFSDALRQSRIVPPEEDDPKLETFISSLRNQGLPYVRRLRSGCRPQVHTEGLRIKPLREMVSEAIKIKEGKIYPDILQRDMILLLDDQMLGYDRTYIENCLGLLACEHLNSNFKEIYIVSRKTSPDPSGDGELMLSPIKAPWSKNLFAARVHVIIKLLEGYTLPLSY